MPPEAPLYHQQPSLQPSLIVNMDNDAGGLSAIGAAQNGGDVPVKRNRSLRRLFPGRHGSGSSFASSMTSNSTHATPSAPQSPTSRGPPVTYNGRFSPYKQEPQYAPRKESSESYRSLQSPSGPSPTPSYLGANIRPPLSEAARQRSMNNVRNDPYPRSPARSHFGDLPPPPTENFSRPRKPSIKGGGEDPRPGLHSANTFPLQPQSQPRNDAPPISNHNPRPSMHERGFSTASFGGSNTSIPIRTLKNSISIPDLTGGREPPIIGPAPPRKASPFATSGINTGASDSHFRELYGRPNPLGDEVRDSQVSNQTMATNATDSTWNSTVSQPWTAASSFLGTERSSIRSKASSTNSLAGREALDDLLGMYEDGFETGDDDDESTNPRPATLRALMARDKEEYENPKKSFQSDRSMWPGPAVKKEETTRPALVAQDKEESGKKSFQSDRPVWPGPVKKEEIARSIVPKPGKEDLPAPPSLAINTSVVRDSTDMFSPTRSADTSAGSAREPRFIDPFHEHPVRQTGDHLEPYQYTKRQPTSLSEAIAERNGAQTPASMFDNSRDRYGFKKKSQHVSLADYEAWAFQYEDHLTRRRRKWVRLLQECGLESEHPRMFPPKSSKTKRFIRKGIPPDWRGEAWWWYGGGPKMLAQNPGLYAELIAKAANGRVSSTDEELIERDLNRTFPDNILFKPDRPLSTTGSDGTVDTETPLLKKLRRVLQATSIYNPKIGYCQSLNFLAGLLLLFMDEERAFWMLDIITKVYLPGTHEVNLEGANVDLGVLMTSVRESMPAVWAKIGGELDGQKHPAASNGAVEHTMRLPPITLCCTAWFMSCFIGTLPIETTLRVWDAFFYEGSKTLFRIALAIFKVGEGELRAVADPMEIFQVVQTIPRRLVDANGLMEACFKRRNGFGHLTQETIEERRRERRKGYRDEREGREVKVEAIGSRPRSKRGLGGLHVGGATKVFDSLKHRK